MSMSLSERAAFENLQNRVAELEQAVKSTAARKTDAAPKRRKKVDADK